jgi:hypothetical protein
LNTGSNEIEKPNEINYNIEIENKKDQEAEFNQHER